jgi:uncharacterized protein with von Willebrand factor type A (vWA) domain
MQNTIEKDIIFLLDESGSMDIMGKEPVQAVNNFINEQKAVLNSNPNFSLYTFNVKVTNVFNNIPISEVPEFSNYEPSNMTSLYDAIGEAITNKKKTERYTNVICVILTDGLDNASDMYTASDIKKLVKKMEDTYKWTFIYLGANQDAFAVGNTIGIKHCDNFKCIPGEIISVSKKLSNIVSNYRVSSLESPYTIKLS